MASKFELSDTTPGAPSGKVNVKWQFDTLGNVSAYVDPPSGGGAVSSVFGRTGAVIAVAGDYDAAKVTNAVDTTQTYSNPAWLTSLAWSKITGAPATGVSTVFGRSGAVTAQSGDYSAAMVTNAVDQTATYSNPAWITALAWSKITGAPTIYTDPLTTKGDLLARGASTTRLGVGSDGQVLTADSAQTLGVKWATPASAPVSSVFTRTGAVTAQSGDYSASQITNAVDQTATYSNPAWITSLAWSKISGAPSVGSYQTPWLQDVNANSFALNNAKGIGIGNAAVVGYGIYCVMNAVSNIISFFQNTNATGAGGFTVRNDGSHSGNIMCAGSTYPNTAWRNNTIVNAGGTTDSLILATNSVERITITSAGNVGVGNDASVLPSADVTAHVIIGATTGTSSGQVNIASNVSGGAGAMGGFGWANYAITATDKRIALIGATTDGAIDSGALQFFTKSVGTMAERMRITAGGNVGIGTAQPGSLVSFGQHAANSSSRIAFFEFVDSTAFRGIGMANPSSGVYGVGIWAFGSGGSPNDSNMAVFVKDGGNVGIGTASPGARLAVASDGSYAPGSTVGLAGSSIVASGSYGGGIGMIDGSATMGMYSVSGAWYFGTGTTSTPLTTRMVLSSSATMLAIGGVLKTLSVDGSGFVKAS